MNPKEMVGVVAGWGYDQFIETGDEIILFYLKMPITLKKIPVNILSKKQCQILYPDRTLQNSQFCGKGKKQGQKVSLVIYYILLSIHYSLINASKTIFKINIYICF